MITKCHYDPKRDITETKPNLSIKITHTFDNMVIKNVAAPATSNGIEHTGQITGRANNVFQVMEATRNLGKYAEEIASQQQAKTTQPE